MNKQLCNWMSERASKPAINEQPSERFKNMFRKSKWKILNYELLIPFANKPVKYCCLVIVSSRNAYGEVKWIQRK